MKSGLCGTQLCIRSDTASYEYNPVTPNVSVPSLSPVIDATKVQANSAEKDKPLRKPLVPMKENATDGELKGVSLGLCIISLYKKLSKNVGYRETFTRSACT